MFNMKITCWYFELRDTFGLLPSSQCDIRAGWNLKLTFFTWFFAMIFLTYLTFARDKEQITWSLWARHGTLWTTSVCAGNPFLEGKAPHTWTGTGGTWFNFIAIVFFFNLYFWTSQTTFSSTYGWPPFSRTKIIPEMTQDVLTKLLSLST